MTLLDFAFASAFLGHLLEQPPPELLAHRLELLLFRIEQRRDLLVERYAELPQCFGLLGRPVSLVSFFNSPSCLISSWKH
ncbi:MAG: hypothetical protein U1E63_15205 [Burkholderiales bacterium]